MSILFFNLRGVPIDEADDVRDLLTTHDIPFYETSAGLLGISLAAIWLHHPDDLPLASRLFDDYQQQRALTQRARYLERKHQGLQPGFWLHNLKQPLRFVMFASALALVIYLSVKWVLELGF